MKAWTRRGFLGAGAAGAAGLLACPGRKAERVVVYTAHDELYSRPILEQWGRRAGVEVAVVYDTEAAKTTGLVTRLLAERDRPRADVFWNNEAAQSVLLAERGVFEAYRPAAAAAMPERYKDPLGYWTGLAARARVIISHTGLAPDPPRSVLDLVRPEWKGRAAIANPLFGTTATHAAALFAALGEGSAREFFRALKMNEVAVLPGNGTVRDLVGSGQYSVGLTDTDDAHGGVLDGLPVAWSFPDQDEGGLGALVIPNTVGLVKGGPNPGGGRALIEYLLSPAVEEKLARGRSMQFPLNPAVAVPAGVSRLAEVRAMNVRFEDIAARMESTARFIQDEFLP